MAAIIRLSQDEVQYILDNARSKTAKEIADWIGCTVPAVHYQLRKHGMKPLIIRKWSPERQARLRLLKAGGMAEADIARSFGTTKDAVHAQLWGMKKRGIEISTYNDFLNYRKEYNNADKTIQEALQGD